MFFLSLFNFFFLLFCYRSIFSSFFSGEQLVSRNAGWSIPVTFSVCIVVVLALCLPWYKSTGKRCDSVFYLLRKQDCFVQFSQKVTKMKSNSYKTDIYFIHKVQCDIWSFGVRMIYSEVDYFESTKPKWNKWNHHQNYASFLLEGFWCCMW